MFNPVEKMELVELSFPDAASAATRTLLRELCERLGKTAVEVPDSAGFVVNKLLFLYLFDAVRLLERNGLEAEAIDTCMTLGAGHPMGPLALLDFVGLDVAAAIGESIGADVPARVHELVAAGKLGRKAGQGFSLRLRAGSEPRVCVWRAPDQAGQGRREAGIPGRYGPDRGRRPAQIRRRQTRAGFRASPKGLRSQNTSASPMPWALASSVTRSHGSVASGRSSQRASSSASSAARSAGPSSGWALTSARKASRCESLSLTHHIPDGPPPARSTFRPKLGPQPDG